MSHTLRYNFQQVPNTGFHKSITSVSYTHLDVYKRQGMYLITPTSRLDHENTTCFRCYNAFPGTRRLESSMCKGKRRSGHPVKPRGQRAKGLYSIHLRDQLAPVGRTPSDGTDVS